MSPLSLTRLLLFVLSLAIPAIPANTLPGPDQALETPGTETFINPTSYLLYTGTLPATPIVTPSTNTTPAADQLHDRGFLYSCVIPFNLTDSRFLTAWCKQTDGSWGNTPPLDLNKCVVNVNGKLGWVLNGNFTHTCPTDDLRIDWYEDSIDTVFLQVGCHAKDGSIRDSELSLDEHVHNYNGALDCAF